MKPLLVLGLLCLAPTAHAGGAANTFVTTGGKTALSMTTLKTKSDGILVRFADKTKLAFNGRQRSATVFLKRDAGASPGWTPFSGTAKAGGWKFDVTVQDQGLRGQRGALVGVNLTEQEPFTKVMRGYGIHFQLKN